MIKKNQKTPSLFSNLSDMLNQSHPLYKLAEKIDWEKFDNAFHSLYCHENGRPGKPIRLMCGLLILKHLRNLSDESIVEQWSENAYYQYFCGMQEFQPTAPCASSELVHFRKRIGEKGIELIFQKSIRVNNENDDSDHHDTAFIDSTVQEKNVTFPTDAKLHKKIIAKTLDIVNKLGLSLRQSYTFVLKRIYRDQRFRNHPKNKKKAYKADRRLRTIAGRLVRELKLNMTNCWSCLKPSSHKDVPVGKRFIPFMNQKSNVSVRVRNTKNTNLVIKHRLYVPPQGLFSGHFPFVMNMMVIQLKHHLSRLNG
jgi:IS5 family transposase